MNQSELSRSIIRNLMDQGKTRDEIISEGSGILYGEFLSGSFEIKSQKVNPESYCRSLISNYLRPGKGIVEGEENHRGPRKVSQKSDPSSNPSNLRSILDYLKSQENSNPDQIQELEEKILWIEYQKVG